MLEPVIVAALTERLERHHRAAELAAERARRHLSAAQESAGEGDEYETRELYDLAANAARTARETLRDAEQITYQFAFENGEAPAAAHSLAIQLTQPIRTFAQSATLAERLHLQAHYTARRVAQAYSAQYN